VEGAVDQPVRISLADREGHRVTVSSGSALQVATGAPLDSAKVGKAIGRLGDTPFEIGELSIDLDDADKPLFLPLGEIKAARREAVDSLLAARRVHHREQRLAPDTVLDTLLPPQQSSTGRFTPALSLLCRTKDQVNAALSIDGIDEIVVDFLEVHGLKDACIQVRSAGRRLIVAAPRIFKPGEERLWRYYCRLAPDALLVRSAGLLRELQRLGGSRTLLDDGETRIPLLHGDFSLNAANLISTGYLLAAGLDRLALTHDLNAEQISALARSLPAQQRSRIEVIAHQHLPIFHTEYCVFARFLSNGNSYRDCGRPCERHTVHLRDPSGGDHLVLADIGCRNTVFNAAAQSAGPMLKSFQKAGIQHYRIELVDEPGHEVAGIVDAYRLATGGQIAPGTLEKRLAAVTDANGCPQGVGPGSLAVRLELGRDAMKKPTAR
jgi:collagenase-like PrtC family protease